MPKVSVREVVESMLSKLPQYAEADEVVIYVANRDGAGWPVESHLEAVAATLSMRHGMASLHSHVIARDLKAYSKSFMTEYVSQRWFNGGSIPDNAAALMHEFGDTADTEEDRALATGYHNDLTGSGHPCAACDEYKGDCAQFGVRAANDKVARVRAERRAAHLASAQHSA
jgi:hypothetical protein